MQPETALQIAIVQAIECYRAQLEGWDFFRYTHIPNPGKLGKAKAAMFKRMGLCAGWPDLTFVWGSYGLVVESGFMEIKHGKGRLSKEQRDFRRGVIGATGCYALVRSPEEAIASLREWGVLPHVR